MKKSLSIYVLTALCFMLILCALSGCDQPAQDTPDLQQARLVASQNRQLQTTIEQKDNRISQLEAEVVNCNQQRDRLKKASDEGTAQIINQAFTGFTDQIQKLKAENEQLKKQLKELKK
jgi:peptidoglycan hydrolase CwlO-like protein